MSVLVLPTQTKIPHYQFAIDLEGTEYALEFHWNERDRAWFLTIMDADEAILLAGLRVLIGANLTARFATAGLPPGSFVAIDTSGGSVEAGIDELGARVLLCYVESAA